MIDCEQRSTGLTHLSTPTCAPANRRGALASTSGGNRIWAFVLLTIADERVPLSMIDFVAVSGTWENRFLVDHLHEHFVDPYGSRPDVVSPRAAPGSAPR
jgi:hypothetical protein